MSEPNDIEVVSIGDFRVFASHCVTLIRDDATGRTLFWHRTELADPAEAVLLWGKPVGTAFGTALEIWTVFHDRAMRFYPRFATDEGQGTTDPAGGRS